MASHRRGRAQEREDIVAYLTDDHAPPGERGAVMLGLTAHAVVFLVLASAQAAWCAVTGVRVWRRREAGWPAAVRTGIDRPTLAGLVAATVVYTGLRRFGLAKLSRRAREHAARRAQDS
jgi:hypothetical protein